MTENELKTLLDNKAKEYGFKNFAEWRNYEHWKFDKIDVFLLELLHNLCNGEEEAPTRTVEYLGKTYSVTVKTDCVAITPAPANPADQYSILNLAINKINESEPKADLERDGNPVCTKCYLVTGAQLNGVMLSELVEASSLCTGSALYDYIHKQLEKKYSPCISIYGISDLGKVAT